MRKLTTSFMTTVGLMTFMLPMIAHAYVGPGAGLSLLGALWGLIAAIGVALFFIIMWPIRRMRRRKKEALIEMNESQKAEAERPGKDKTPPSA